MVTTTRSDGGGIVKHYGDITKLSGYELPIVDVITGGSPCQDLSVAGKREGLAGERSGLFMEQIRIVKEMRENDRNSNGRTNGHIRPRYMVWENVPGAFSSNKGKDFQAVITEIIRIVEPESPDVPMPEKKWGGAGCLYDDMGKWSVAWRVHDAQFWGVPQRRKRIALVADFGGLSAPEILFERKGLSGDFEQGEPEREEAAGSTGESLNPPVARILSRRHDGSYATDRDPDVMIEPSKCLTSWDCQSKRIFEPDGTCATLNSGTNEGGNIVPSVFCLQGNGIDRADTAGCNGKGWCEDQSYTLNTIDRPAVYDACGNGGGYTVPTMTGDHQNRITDYTAIVLNDQGGGYMNVSYDKTGTIRSQMSSHPPITIQ